MSTQRGWVNRYRQGTRHGPRFSFFWKPVVTPTTMAAEAGAGLVGAGAGALSPWLPPPQDRTKAVKSSPRTRAHRGGDIVKIAVQ